MILGMSTPLFTLIHVLISLAAIGSGLIVIPGLGRNQLSGGLTASFLIMTALTSLTGFLFPFHGVTRGIVLGILSTIALLLAVVALYGAKLAGIWRGVYVVSATLALYFNVFALIAQSFEKIPALKAIAPTEPSPIWGATELVVLAIFVVLTIGALKGFKGIELR